MWNIVSPTEHGYGSEYCYDAVWRNYNLSKADVCEWNPGIKHGWCFDYYLNVIELGCIQWEAGPPPSQ